MTEISANVTPGRTQACESLVYLRLFFFNLVELCCFTLRCLGLAGSTICLIRAIFGLVLEQFRLLVGIHVYSLGELQLWGIRRNWPGVGGDSVDILYFVLH